MDIITAEQNGVERALVFSMILRILLRAVFFWTSCATGGVRKVQDVMEAERF